MVHGEVALAAAQMPAGVDWPLCPKCLAKPEQVTRQHFCEADSCPVLHPLPTQYPVAVMAVLPPAAVGLLPQAGPPGTSAPAAPQFILLLPPAWPLLWRAAEPHSHESLRNMDVTQGEKPLQSWGLPAPWDLCTAAKLLEPGQCGWRWAGGTGTVSVGHACAGAWVRWCAQLKRGSSCPKGDGWHEQVQMGS